MKLNSLAGNAFLEYRSEFKDWPFIDTAISYMSKSAKHVEIFITQYSDTIVGGVALVAPEFRGKGIGFKLTEKCIERVTEIGASSIGLYTSSIMQIALAMNLKMGFVKLKKYRCNRWC